MSTRPCYDCGRLVIGICDCKKRRRVKPFFCQGCGVMVTREPWPHLARELLSGGWAAANQPAEPAQEGSRRPSNTPANPALSEEKGRHE